MITASGLGSLICQPQATAQSNGVSPHNPTEHCGAVGLQELEYSVFQGCSLACEVVDVRGRVWTVCITTDTVDTERQHGKSLEVILLAAVPACQECLNPSRATTYATSNCPHAEKCNRPIPKSSQSGEQPPLPQSRSRRGWNPQIPDLIQ